MGRLFDCLRNKLRLRARLSTLLTTLLATRLLTLWFIPALLVAGPLAMVQPVRAHEVTPTIADLTVRDGLLRLELRLNIEAFVAGIDLDGMEDTDQSPYSGRYDALRALGPAELLPIVERFTALWLRQVIVETPARVDLTVSNIQIPEVGDADVPRPTHLTLTGQVAPGTRVLRLVWPDGAGALVLRQQGVADPFTGYIPGGGVSPPIPLEGGVSQSWWEAFATYVPVGFVHILPGGLDHILFVLGLFFLSPRLRPLVWQISAFTLAHTMALGFGAMGWVRINPAIIEPLIAASIVFVALENVFVRRLHGWRPAVVFGFGLLHGLGFASVLSEFGLPDYQFFAALLGFNLGVELGQIVVLLAAFATVGLWFRNRPWYRGRIAIPASIVIAMIGGYWFVERVFG